MNDFKVGDLVYWYPDMSLTPYIVMKIYSGFNEHIKQKEKYIDLLALTQDPNMKEGVMWSKKLVLDKNKPNIFKVMEYKKKYKK